MAATTTRPAPMERPVYPFSAVVGQAALKRALLLNAVDPSIGGALIRGEKGTAKTTVVRALPSLLPPIRVVDGCPFACGRHDPPAACPQCALQMVEPGGRVPNASDRMIGYTAVGPPGDGQAPERLEGTAGLGEQAVLTAATDSWGRRLVERPVPLVELPIGASEERVTGSFDLEAAIQRGERRFQPGLLAAAHRGILYVDEVNLLPDHLVDVILDAAATGVHRVEREGISIAHSARFMLVGTMNPEEGELRPQLIDRFGLAVDVATPRDPADRATIVRRRAAFDADPARFTAHWRSEDHRLRTTIRQARARLPRVRLSDDLLDLVVRICIAYEVDGLRADVTIFKAAAVLAALDGRQKVTAGDVRAGAELALPHRRRRRPSDEHGMDRSTLDDLVDAFERQAGSDAPRTPRDGNGSTGSGPASGVPPEAGPDGISGTPSGQRASI